MVLALPLLRGVDAAKCPSIDGLSAANIPTINPRLRSISIFSGKTTARAALISRGRWYRLKLCDADSVSWVCNLFYAKHKALSLRVPHIVPPFTPLPASRSSVGIGGSVSLALKQAADWWKLPPDFRRRRLFSTTAVHFCSFHWVEPQRIVALTPGYLIVYDSKTLLWTTTCNLT